MKIIAKDNFDRENVADYLVAENVHLSYAHEIATFLQSKYGGEQASRYYTVVDDEYRLWGGMAELV